jgi:hypothetical protein
MHEQTVTMGVVTPAEQVLQLHPSLDAYGPTFVNAAALLVEEHADVADAYLSVYERLAMQAGNTAWMFPEDEQEAARIGTVGLFGSTIQTVREHHTGEPETRTEIPLKGRPPAPFELYGTEPLMWLEALAQTYWAVGQVMNSSPNSTVRSVLAEQGDGYSICRFIDTDPRATLPPCVSLYIRDTPSDTYNPKREYGSRAGVEASIAVEVDVKLLREHLAGLSNEMIGLGTSKRANDGVICLRVDRSGVRVTLPDGTTRRLSTTQDGTTSHDIGRVLRDSAGRLLALHNKDLNHLEGVLSAELGQRDSFAAYAQSVGKLAADRLIRAPELRAILKAQRSARASTDGFPYFELGQNPYDIPGVRELGRRSGVELDAEPSEAQLQTLFNVWGSQKAFQYNIAAFRGAAQTLGHEALVRLLYQTGMMDAMPLRSIYGPEPNVKDVSTAVVMEGVVPWMIKRLAYLRAMKNRGLEIGSVSLGATERPLNTPTEWVHPDVVALQRQLRRQPTAVDFMRGPATDFLRAMGIQHVNVTGLPYKQVQADGTEKVTSGSDVARALTAEHPELANGRVLNALNAPAGAMFYDLLSVCLDKLTDFSAEQFYFGSGRTLLAKTYEDNITTKLFQSPYSAPSPLVRWLATLYRANQRFSGTSAYSPAAAG